MENQQEQATMFTKLGNIIMRALFDPELQGDKMPPAIRELLQGQVEKKQDVEDKDQDEK